MRKRTTGNFAAHLLGVFAAALLVFIAVGSPVYASGKDTAFFDFSGQSFTVNAGESVTFSLTAGTSFKVFKVGGTDSRTYIQTTGQQGFSYATIHTSSAETTSQVTFFFYANTSDEHYDRVTVTIRPRKTQEVAMSAAAIAFPDGTVGTAATFPGSEIAIVSNAANVPIATFTVGGRYGREKILLGEPYVVNGITLLNVTTPNDPAASNISISSSDARGLRSVGIYGIALNGQTCFWPDDLQQGK